MNILVTGGAGFIGSHLCEYLANKGFSLTVIDDLSSGFLTNLSFVMEDITFYEEKLEFFDFNKLHKIDVIVHLAAQPSVPISIENFGSSSSSNILSSIKVIDYCRVNNIPLVYASSSAIYGNLILGDDKKSNNDLLTPYAVDKFAMEVYSKTAFKHFHLSSIGLRFFNVYGPRQDSSSSYSGVISKFIHRLLLNQEIFINGGYQTRDFIYVEDVIEIIHKSIILVTKNSVCDQMNVLTGKSVSIDEIANILIKKTGCCAEKIYQELPIGDPKQSVGSIEKITNLLDVDLNNMTHIDYGLSKTLDFMRNQLNS